MPKADMLHLSSCLRRDGRPPSARPGLRRSERSRNCSALLSVRLQLGPDYPWPPDLLDSLPGFVRFAACIVTPLVVWICPLKKCLQKKENGFHNKDRKPTASHAVWWMSAKLHKNMRKKCNPLPLQCKHTGAKERLFNWTITNDQQGLIDDFRILRASGTEALNSEV